MWGAAVVTAMGFAGLSLVAWTTRKDLSFLVNSDVGVWALILIVAAFYLAPISEYGSQLRWLL